MLNIKHLTINTVRISSPTSWLLRKIIETKTLLKDIGGLDEVVAGQHFSTKKAYLLLQDTEWKDWRRLVCNNSATPESNFILACYSK